MTEKCPHCLMRVMPRADGHCPSCGKGPEDQVENVGRALVELENHRQIPGICCQCAEPTTSVSAQTFYLTDGSLELPAGLEFLLSFFAFVVSILVVGFGWLRIGGAEAPMPRIQADLPMCKPCKRALGKVRPRHVDFRTGVITIECHEKFRTALIETRCAERKEAFETI